MKGVYTSDYTKYYDVLCMKNNFLIMYEAMHTQTKQELSEWLHTC